MRIGEALRRPFGIVCGTRKLRKNAERGGIPLGGRLWHSQVLRRISISFSSPNGKREGDCAENGGDFRRLGNGGERDAHGSFSEYGPPTDFPRASAEGGSLYIDISVYVYRGRRVAAVAKYAKNIKTFPFLVVADVKIPADRYIAVVAKPYGIVYVGFRGFRRGYFKIEVFKQMYVSAPDYRHIVACGGRSGV